MEANSETKKKWYQTTGGIIALLVLFFPVGLYMMWKHATWNKIAKWIITGVFAFIILISALTDSSETSTTTNSQPNNQANNQTSVQDTQERTKPQPTKPEPTTDPNPKFTDGTHEVGKDIKAGIYRTRVGSSGCYYSRLSGFSGELSEILANENTDYPAVVEIKATDKGFKSSRCGTWTQDLSQITKSKTSFKDGIYIVGTDIEAGTYKNTGSTGCYYSRLAGFSGGLGDIISNENTDEQAIVSIASTDKGFKSSRCGIWTNLVNNEKSKEGWTEILFDIGEWNKNDGEWTTNEFSIESNKWRVTWAKRKLTQLSIDVYEGKKVDDNNKLIKHFLADFNETRGVLNFEGSGTYYIHSIGGTSPSAGVWEIKVEELSNR